MRTLAANCHSRSRDFEYFPPHRVWYSVCIDRRLGLVDESALRRIEDDEESVTGGNNEEIRL